MNLVWAGTRLRTYELADRYLDEGLFFFYWYGDHRDLHSFPTRRSSDLDGRPDARAIELLLAPQGPRQDLVRRGRHREVERGDDALPQVVVQLLLELRGDLLRAGHDQVVEAPPLEEPQQHLGHVLQVLLPVLVDV